MLGEKVDMVGFARQPRKTRGKVFRPVLMAVVLAVVCWAFLSNNQRRLDALAMQGLLKDEVKALSSAQREEIIVHLKSFKRDFGVPIEVAILKQAPPLQSHDATRIYLDIVPSQGRMYVFLPPLVKNAMGKEFMREMEAFLDKGFEAGQWQADLITAILALQARLAEVTR